MFVCLSGRVLATLLHKVRRTTQLTHSLAHKLQKIAYTEVRVHTGPLEATRHDVGAEPLASELPGGQIKADFHFFTRRVRAKGT